MSSEHPEPPHLRRLLRHVSLANAIRLVLILSIALNLALARRIRLLEGAINVTKSRNQLAVGRQMRPVDVLREDGALDRINYNDAAVPTLLYIMSPTCVFCQYNLPNLKALLDQAKGKYRVVILSVVRDGLEEYRETYGIEAPISTIAPQSQFDLQISGTPGTIFISRGGALIALWRGAFNSDQKDEIERLLAVDLPGIDASGAGPG